MPNYPFGNPPPIHTKNTIIDKWKLTFIYFSILPEVNSQSSTREHNFTCISAQSINLDGGNIDNYYINIPNEPNCQNQLNVTNIPPGSWIGFVARQFDNGENYDDLLTIANESRRFSGVKKINNTLLYREYVANPTQNTVIIKLTSGNSVAIFGRFYKYRLEIMGKWENIDGRFTNFLIEKRIFCQKPSFSALCCPIAFEKES